MRKLSPATSRPQGMTISHEQQQTDLRSRQKSKTNHSAVCKPPSLVTPQRSSQPSTSYLPVCPPPHSPPTTYSARPITTPSPTNSTSYCHCSLESAASVIRSLLLLLLSARKDPAGSASSGPLPILPRGRRCVGCVWTTLTGRRWSGMGGYDARCESFD